MNAYNTIQNNQIYLKLIECSRMDELSEKVNKISEIVNSAKPYSQIKELPPLTSDVNNIFKELFNDYKSGVEETIGDISNNIVEEATKAGLDSEQYTHRFAINVTNMLETSDDFSKLSALKNMAGRYYNDILKLINEDAIKKQQAETPDTPSEQEEVKKPVVKELDFVNPANISSKQILETEEDVDNYVDRLREELKSKIRANKRIKLKEG